MEFGSFNYAPRNTLLHGKMVERHLYDMIPNAWKKLGKSVLPLPIPKPVSASVKARRQSVPARYITASTASAPMITASRVMTRRMSIIFDMNQSNDKNSEQIVSSSIGPNSRQSIQAELPATREYLPGEKMTSSQLDQKNASPFKVPTVPRARKTFPNRPSRISKPFNSKAKTHHSADMIALHNAIIEKNHQKITECIRMSLKDSLFDFLSKKSV